MEKIISRKDVEESLKWDLCALYKNEEDYEKDILKLGEMAFNLSKKYEGKLNTPQDINSCIDEYRKLYEIFDKTSHFAYLNLEADYTDENAMKRYNNFEKISSKVLSKTSFIESQILKLDEKIIKEALDLSLKNKNFLNELIRKKSIMLSEKEENMLAKLKPVFDSFYNTYNISKMVDMEFDSFEVDGKKYNLSYNIFEGFMETHKDTKVRRKAFEVFEKKLKEYESTTASIYISKVNSEKIMADIRGFDSVIDYLLFEQNISRQIYDNQIDTIMEKLAPHMRRYANLIKEKYDLDEMTYMDLKLPVEDDFDREISIDEAKDMIIDALSLYGEEYKDMLKSSFENRAIDFANNKGKSTGAFCASPYLSHSFILLTWTRSLAETMVLAHELGHAGHFYYANKYQNILDTEPSMYFIEAPSTTNELLMGKYLLKNAKSDKEKRYIISQIIARTYYHNFVTHFIEAYYQREVYRAVDRGESLDANMLNTIFKQSLEKFWGNDVKIGDGAYLTWMRQPHYYMGLYPYTYSCGLTIGTVMSEKILEDESIIKKWIEVLKQGGIKDPKSLCKMVDIDITNTKALEKTIEYIGYLVDEIKRLG